MRNHVRNADIIHSFIQPNRTAKSDDALNTVVAYGENTTKNPLTSQEDLLKTRENLFITEILRVGLKDNWKGEKLPNHWVITSCERLENSESLYTSPLITKSEILPLNSNENPTTNALKSQEPLSEQAKAKKLAKLESEKRIKEVSKKSAEKTENQFTLEQRLTRRTLSTLSFRRIAKNAKKQ